MKKHPSCGWHLESCSIWRGSNLKCDCDPRPVIPQSLRHQMSCAILRGKPCDCDQS